MLSEPFMLPLDGLVNLAILPPAPEVYLCCALFPSGVGFSALFLMVVCFLSALT